MVRRKGMPTLRESVICTAKKITPFAAWCTLDEYSNLEGMIHISEVAGKWVYDIREFVKQGKQYVAKVVRIDTEKNVVNLSLKRVSSREEKEKLNLYRKEQRAEKILEQAGKGLKKTLDQAYDEVGYMLQEKFGDMYSAFEEIKKKPEILEELDVPKNWSSALKEIIEIAFKEKEVILRADVELKSYASDGVEKIKSSLSNFEKKSKVKVKYISAPKYRIEIKTNDPKNVEKKLREELEKLMKNTKTLGIEGSYKFVK